MHVFCGPHFSKRNGEESNEMRQKKESIPMTRTSLSTTKYLNNDSAPLLLICQLMALVSVQPKVSTHASRHTSATRQRIVRDSLMAFTTAVSKVKFQGMRISLLVRKWVVGKMQTTKVNLCYHVRQVLFLLFGKSSRCASSIPFISAGKYQTSLKVSSFYDRMNGRGEVIWFDCLQWFSGFLWCIFSVCNNV